MGFNVIFPSIHVAHIEHIQPSFFNPLPLSPGSLPPPLVITVLLSGKYFFWFPYENMRYLSFCS